MYVCGYVTVKAFLAQAKEEFSKKWDEAAQVSHTHDMLIRFIDICYSYVTGIFPDKCVESELLFSYRKPVSGL